MAGCDLRQGYLLRCLRQGDWQRGDRSCPDYRPGVWCRLSFSAEVNGAKPLNCPKCPECLEGSLGECIWLTALTLRLEQQAEAIRTLSDLSTSMFLKIVGPESIGRAKVSWEFVDCVDAGLESGRLSYYWVRLYQSQQEPPDC